MYTYLCTSLISSSLAKANPIPLFLLKVESIYEPSHEDEKDCKMMYLAKMTLFFISVLFIVTPNVIKDFFAWDVSYRT